MLPQHWQTIWNRVKDLHKKGLLLDDKERRLSKLSSALSNASDIISKHDEFVQELELALQAGDPLMIKHILENKSLSVLEDQEKFTHDRIKTMESWSRGGFEIYHNIDKNLPPAERIIDFYKETKAFIFGLTSLPAGTPMLPPQMWFGVKQKVHRGDRSLMEVNLPSWEIAIHMTGNFTSRYSFWIDCLKKDRRETDWDMVKHERHGLLYRTEFAKDLQVLSQLWTQLNYECDTLNKTTTPIIVKYPQANTDREQAILDYDVIYMILRQTIEDEAPSTRQHNKPQGASTFECVVQ
jgi:hypothetical protein